MRVYPFLLIWEVSRPAGENVAEGVDPEYAALLGATAKGASAMPGPLEVGQQIYGITFR